MPMTSQTVRMHIMSRNRNNPHTTSSGCFTVGLNKALNGVTSCRLVSASIPMSYYLIGPSSDTFWIKEAGVLKHILIAETDYGTYNVDELMALLNTYGNAFDGHNTYEFAYNIGNTRTNKVTITRKTGNINWAPAPWSFREDILAYQILGFVPEGYTDHNGNPVNYVEGPGPFLATNVYHGAASVHNVYVMSKVIFNEDQFASTSQVLQRDCVATVPVDYGSDVVHYSPDINAQTLFVYRRPRFFETIDITLIAHEGENGWRRLNFQGHEIELTFEATHINV